MLSEVAGADLKQALQPVREAIGTLETKGVELQCALSLRKSVYHGSLAMVKADQVAVRHFSFWIH